jgi:hypothetical protein
MILTLNITLPFTFHHSGRKSTDCWETALLFAQQCCDEFKEKFETIEDAERNSTKALEMLAKRQALIFTAVFLLLSMLC